MGLYIYIYIYLGELSLSNHPLTCIQIVLVRRMSKKLPSVFIEKSLCVVLFRISKCQVSKISRPVHIPR